MTPVYLTIPVSTRTEDLPLSGENDGGVEAAHDIDWGNTFRQTRYLHGAVKASRLLRTQSQPTYRSKLMSEHR